MDYQEQTLQGSSYQRCNRIVIENPRNSDPAVTFIEEKIIVTGDNTIAIPANNFAIAIDPTESIALRNPETWELTGATITLGELYAAIASVYWQKALERDAQQQPAE
jgi:hypothetical protein